jgi:hypothetical protein
MTGDLWSYETLRRRWEMTRHGLPGVGSERTAYRSPEKVRRARGSEVIAALKEAFGATGDPRLVAAIEALKESGFDQPNAKTLQRFRAVPIEANCIRRIEQLRAREPRPSVRSAAARTAVEFHVEGATFDAVVRRLERAYRACET